MEGEKVLGKRKGTRESLTGSWERAVVGRGVRTKYERKGPDKTQHVHYVLN